LKPFATGSSLELNHWASTPPERGIVIAVPIPKIALNTSKRGKLWQNGTKIPEARRSAPRAKALFIPNFAAIMPDGTAKVVIIIGVMDTAQLTVPLLTPYSCMIRDRRGPREPQLIPTAARTIKTRTAITNR
jgi:hypothetical protein